jgi:hypothetical protein
MKRLLLFLAFPIALAAQQPTPELSLTANGAQDMNLYPGWPMIVHATIMNSLRFTAGNVPPLVIAPNGAPWTSAIQFTAVDASGQAHEWPLNLIGSPADPALTLAPTSYVSFTMQIAPTDVSSLAPGTYQLTATLQVSNSNAWNGIVQSRPITIQVGLEPTLTAEQQTEKALLIAEYQTNSGDLKGALTTVQQLLQSQPSSPLALDAAANLLEVQGFHQVALMEANAAADAYYQTDPAPAEAPSDLLTLQQDLLAGVISASSGATNTSASSAEVTFSPADQTVILSAKVASANGPVDGGTVIFAITGVGNPVTSPPVTVGNTSAVFTIPRGAKAGNYSIKAAYSGTSAFSPSVDTAHMLTIAKATPNITWNPPASVPAGTALSSAQLNATASVPGTFVYNPPAGTILASGTAETLNVTFTPSDSTDYNSASAAVSLTVLAGSFSGSIFPTAATVHVGRSKNFNVTITSSNFVGAVTLSCTQPPAGISCQFAPTQVNLDANASSTTVLTVSVSAKPAVLAPRSSPNWRLGQFMVTTFLMICILPFVYFIAMRYARENPHLGRQSAAFPYALVFLSLLSVYLISCSGLPDRSGGGFGGGSGGGGSSPSSASLVVQGTSGMTTVKLGTVSITVH